jgi:hypothetical protein
MMRIIDFTALFLVSILIIKSGIDKLTGIHVALLCFAGLIYVSVAVAFLVGTINSIKNGRIFY